MKHFNVESFAFLKTHKLHFLLEFTGRAEIVRTKHLSEWSVVQNWDPEARYDPTKIATDASLAVMIEAARKLLKVLK